VGPVDPGIPPVGEGPAAIGHADDDIAGLKLVREELPGSGGRKGHSSIAAEGEGRGEHGAVGGARKSRGGGVVPASAGPASCGSGVVGVGPSRAGSTIGRSVGPDGGGILALAAARAAQKLSRS